MRRRALSAEARAAQIQREFEHKVALLDATVREALDRKLDRPQPLRHPPVQAEVVLRELQAYHPDDPFAIPIGWQVSADGQPDLLTASLHGESDFFTGNVMITAMTRWGKNILECLITICLFACRHGCRSSILMVRAGWESVAWGGAQLARAGLRDTEIPGAIQALDNLRRERMTLLARYEVTKWEELSADVRPPADLGCNELTLLEQVWQGARGRGWRPSRRRWLGAFAIASLCRTRPTGTGWRRNVGLAIAGGQVSRDADKPNLGLSTAEIKERGAPTVRTAGAVLVYGAALP